MTHAYSELYLDDAMNNLGDMVEYAVCDLGFDPDEFFGWFISSGIASKFEKGNPKYIAGLSGFELAEAVLRETNVSYEKRDHPILSLKDASIGPAGFLLITSGRPVSDLKTS